MPSDSAERPPGSGVPASKGVIVIGAGAVGSWLGAALAASGVAVTLVVRGPHAEAVNRGGLLRISRAGKDLLTPVAHTSIGAALAAGASTAPAIGLVTVKSYQTVEAADELAELGLDIPLVSFQNGVGNVEVLTERASSSGRATVLAATLTNSVRLVETGGGIGLALPRDTSREEATAARWLVDRLERGGLQTRLYHDPHRLKWSKLLLNMLGAATCALLGQSPATALRNSGVFELERDAWLEALAVMRARGIRPVALPGYPVNLYALIVRALPRSIQGYVLSSPLAAARGERLPGPAVDMASGRARTEVEALHGAVAAEAELLGICAPICGALARLTAEMAAGSIPRDAFASDHDALVAAVRSAERAA